MDKKYIEYEKRENLQYTGETADGYTFVDCAFINCSFEDCRLIKCSFLNCTFDHCVVKNLHTEYSQVQEAEFTDCHLVGVHWGQLLPGGRFADPIRKLQDCHLKYNTFTNINFRKFHFSGTEIFESMFAECQLVDSNFKDCKLERTEFFKCDMQKADFRDASGYKVDMMSCKVKGARFSLPDVLNLLSGFGIKID